MIKNLISYNIFKYDLPTQFHNVCNSRLDASEWPIKSLVTPNATLLVPLFHLLSNIAIVTAQVTTRKFHLLTLPA